MTKVTAEFTDYLQVRGGKANNSATVLAHLGFQAEFCVLCLKYSVAQRHHTRDDLRTADQKPG